MSDPHIRCRFVSTPKSAVAYVTYQTIVMTIRCQRTDDPDADARHLKTLVVNLPQILAKGADEVWVQDQARRLDYEIEEFFRDMDAEEGKSDE